MSGAGFSHVFVLIIKQHLVTQTPEIITAGFEGSQHLPAMICHRVSGFWSQ